MLKYLEHFNSKLYPKENDIYPYDCVEINGRRKKEQILNEKNINDRAIMKQVEHLINEIDNLKDPSNSNIQQKKKKIKKMKNYNIRKGDWQCKHCYNINFHFRIICNICHKVKV